MSFDIEKVETAIDATSQKFSDAVSQGDSVAIAGLYHSEGVLMAPFAESIMGKDNLASFFGTTFRIGINGIVLRTTEVTGNAEAVFETGTYEVQGRDGVVLDKGKYLVVWKQEDGQWKIFRDIWNTSMPPVAKN